MHTDDDAGTQTGSPARPSVGYPIVIDKQGQTAYRGSRLTPFGQNRKPVSCASTGRDFLFFPLPLLFCRLCHILRHSSRSNPVYGKKTSSVLCMADCLFSDYTSMHLPWFIIKRNRNQKNFIDMKQCFSDTQMPFWFHTDSARELWARTLFRQEKSREKSWKYLYFFLLFKKHLMSEWGSSRADLYEKERHRLYRQKSCFIAVNFYFAGRFLSTCKYDDKIRAIFCCGGNENE